MVRELKADHRFYAFSAETRPALTVAPGEELVLETQDGYSNQIRRGDEPFSSVDWKRVNPATGPIFVTGAEPGDILVADILEVALAEHGVMVVVPGMGALGDEIREFQSKIVLLRGEVALFSERIEIPLRPMIGVIGTAPEEGTVANHTPGPHGGNMDCILVTEGSKVYLPVEVPGALFGVGDLHAVMGDGEVIVCGLEVAGRVRVRLGLLKEARVPAPLVENIELVATIYSDEDVDAAAQGAIENMARLLTEEVGIPLSEAGMLMSIVGQLRICQVVDPLKTCRMEFPKWVLEQYGFVMEEMQ